jgi:TPR repeat protein
MFSAALAATLPGVSVPFQVGADGKWELAPDLSAPLVSAGAKPGWVLLAVDDVPVTDPVATQRQVAAGPARNVQLRFRDPAASPGVPPKPAKGKAAAPAPLPAEIVLVVKRAELIHVEPVGTVTWPSSFEGPPTGWREDWAGIPLLPDANGTMFVLDSGAASLTETAATEASAYTLPEVLWTLAEAPWVVSRPAGVTQGDTAWAKGQFGSAARVRSFKGRPGDYLLLAGPSSVEVLAVTWPSGTASLPTCSARVPETCLTSGRQILEDLGSKPGARAEALRHLGLACANGVHRGCYEAVALETADLAPTVNKCIDESDVAACNTVARRRFDLNPEEPDDLVLGLLEYACEIEGAGTLGERLRRLEDVGAGCMQLAAAYDLRQMPDQALLNLDQACVLGRADACEQATERRQQAFAARTVRECEDASLPIAGSCVELGKILQIRPVAAATVDDFGAFLRGCNLGAADGCLLLGDYVDRWGIDHPRVVEAETQLRQSCQQGEQRACLGAAHLLVRHDPSDDAYGEALTLFDGACTGGLGPACVAAAQQRRIGKARQVTAPDQITMWNKACEQLAPDGCAGLGERLSRKKTELPLAYNAWTKACDLGDSHSCSELGRLVTKPHEPLWPGEQPSTAYLQRGCENGDPVGCYWLAEATLPKKGEPPEPIYLLLDQSCEGEYGPGCASLADVHLERESSFDDEIAARHLDTACNNGFYDSCKTLGFMYLRGKGVERDRVKANEMLDRFRLNANRKYVRLGVQIGVPTIAGGELELVLPIPVGPALTISASGSYLPELGGYLLSLKDIDPPDDRPALLSLGASARLYPNHQARGLFFGVGVHQWEAVDSDAVAPRFGWSGRMGLRNDAKYGFSGLEVGLAQMGVIEFADFDDEEPLDKTVLPLILPSIAFTFGLAPF